MTPEHTELLAQLTQALNNRDYGEFTSDDPTTISGELEQLSREWQDAGTVAGFLNEQDIEADGLLTYATASSDLTWEGTLIVGSVEAGWLIEFNVNFGEYSDDEHDGNASVGSLFGTPDQVRNYVTRTAIDHLKTQLRDLSNTTQNLFQAIASVGADTVPMYRAMIEQLRGDSHLAPVLALDSADALTEAVAQVGQKPATTGRKPRM